MTNIINIGVDLDGVCANFIKKFSTLANEMYGSKCYIIEDIEQVKHWNWLTWYPIKSAEENNIWKKIINTKNFWISLEVLNLIQWEYFVDKINRANNINVYFITTRTETIGMSAARQSAMWLENNGWKYPFVINTKQKERIVEDLNIEFFIDDNAENIINVKNNNPKCRVYVKDAPYNRDLLAPLNIEYKKVSGLRQFADDILAEIYKREYSLNWKVI